MNWNWRAIRAIMRKDLRQVMQNKMVWMPMVIVPVLIQIVLPLVIVLIPQFMGDISLELDDMQPLLEMLPDPVQLALQGMAATEQWVVLTANYMFAPMFLIVPLMVSSILGSDSFVGEKERRTLESLFYTPVGDVELFVAKVLTALVPAQVVSLGSFVIYGVVVNLAGYPIAGRIFFPTDTWWPLVFWMGPAVSVLGIGATVVVSSRAKSFVQAQQISGVLVLPIVFMMIGQSAGLFFLSITLTMIFGAFAWALGMWLIWVGAKTFSRDRLMSRL